MLNPQKLQRSFLDYFEDPGPFKEPVDAAMEWTRIYDAYARDAVDASQDKVQVVNKPGFFAQLQFNASSGSPPSFASMLDKAFVAYWTGAVFAFGIPPTPAAPCPSIGGNTIFSQELTSLVIAVAPGVLMAQLLPIFSSVTEQENARSQSQKIANAFHTATTTAVTVLIAGLDTTPPPGGPQPITNTCTIF